MRDDWRTATRGWWRDHDGKTQAELVSGAKDDPLYDEARELLRKLGLPREALDRASHVEIKLATVMRRAGQPLVDLVINNVVCGTNNPEWKYTCDTLLPKLLRPGQRLTIDGVDKFGRRYSRTYEGEPE
ncbi:DddA-like double-stranded DNA deaminase toxin [Longispora sp. K20-0274]|uniref:DddA-like double-stranded DNA deaminase toxin n=1 Tax=Longispora sp. K20-0274 TaxID=3088255 RepID=UPI003999AC77